MTVSLAHRWSDARPPSAAFSHWTERDSIFTWPACIALALVMHLGFIAGARRQAPPEPVTNETRVTEIELAPPPPPPDAPEPPAPVAKAAEGASAPAAARAGRLLTAVVTPNSRQADELVDFVSDPNGGSYGAGVVAVGGTADYGVAGAVAGGRGSRPGSGAGLGRGSNGDGLTAAENLSRTPSLDEADACAGFYPSQATVDAGLVTVALVVRSSGQVTNISVINEAPLAQGFADAARNCLRSKRFTPGLDKQGRAVNAAANLRLRFNR